MLGKKFYNGRRTKKKHPDLYVEFAFANVYLQFQMLSRVTEFCYDFYFSFVELKIPL